VEEVKKTMYIPPKSTNESRDKTGNA